MNDTRTGHCVTSFVFFEASPRHRSTLGFCEETKSPSSLRTRACFVAWSPVSINRPDALFLGVAIRHRPPIWQVRHRASNVRRPHCPFLGGNPRNPQPLEISMSPWKDTRGEGKDGVNAHGGWADRKGTHGRLSGAEGRSGGRQGGGWILPLYFLPLTWV